MQPSSLLLRTLACGFALVVDNQIAAAAGHFPDRPVHLYVGFSAGGSADFVARLVAQKLSERWNQAVIVENKAGADGTIAEDVVAHSPPDGYALSWITSAHTVTATQFKLDYDPTKSFAPITRVGYSTDALFISPSLPINSVNDLVAYAKANPNKLNFAANGTADPSYLEAQLFMKLTDTKMVAVNYQGGGQVLTAMLGGEVQVWFGTLSTAAAMIKAGQLKALGVTASQRAPAAPDLPTIAEAGNLPSYEATTWYGVLGPAGLPPDLIGQLHDDFKAVITSPDVERILAARGFVTVAGTPDDLAKTMSDDIAKWAPFLKTIAK